MKFLSKWLYKKTKQGQELAEESMMATSISKLAIAEPGHRIDSDRGIRFNVYKATGGTIIETSFYDRQRDRHHNALHVITEDKDIGKELGKIITMESLKT
jgi:hypothetical protein